MYLLTEWEIGARVRTGHMINESFHIHYIVYKIVNNINCPRQLTGYLMKRSQRHCRTFRDPTLLDLPQVETKCGQTSFKFSAASAWNKLPREFRELTTLAQFKGKHSLT